MAAREERPFAALLLLALGHKRPGVDVDDVTWPTAYELVLLARNRRASRRHPVPTESGRATGRGRPAPHRLGQWPAPGRPQDSPISREVAQGG